jgi:glycosyltransferase involved in cell wall biosynthesis
MTFKGLALTQKDTQTIYGDKSVLAVMVVSEDNRRYLKYVFPEKRIFRVHNSIDTGLFRHERDKKKQICYMPRKNHDEFVQLFSILNLRAALKGWTLVAIENKSRREVAAILRESIFFINLVYQEGFGLPSAEAMACGCTVIGYHGRGGQEFYHSDFCYPVETGDIVKVAKTVEHVLELYQKSPQYLQGRACKASEFIMKNYSAEIQKRDVLEFWYRIMR